ncbi:MAG: ribonuclease Z [Gemmiger sp.]
MVQATLLGCGGTQPLPDRALSAFCLTAGGSTVLFDCGEGTQAAARRAGVSIFKIDAVLLTHFHGDHIFGIPGLWQTMAGLGRRAPLLMAGPPGLERLLQTMYSFAGPLPFEIRTIELADCRGAFEVPIGCITAFPARHRIPCCGYAYTLPRAGRFDPERARAKGIPVRYWHTLQEGHPVGGFVPDDVLGPPRRGLKVVYCTDTRPCATLERAARDADLLCMDATYADDADLPKAKLYGHATCREAGALAVRAGARRLWLTHYSGAVTDPGPGLLAAQSEFAAAQAGFDGKRLTLNFTDE